jgi:hypothetical protein
MSYGPTYGSGFPGYDRKRPVGEQQVSGGGETWGTTFSSDRQRDMFMTVVARGRASGFPDQAEIRVSTRDPDAILQAVYCGSSDRFVLPNPNEDGVTVISIPCAAIAVSETKQRISRATGQSVPPLTNVTWKHSLGTMTRIAGAAGANAISIAQEMAQHQAQNLRYVLDGMAEARPVKLDTAVFEGVYDAATNTIVYTVDMVVTFRARQSSVMVSGSGVTFGNARGDVFPAM